MLSARLVWLIENHAEALARAAVQDMATHPRTPSLHALPRAEMEARVYRLYHNLGRWVGIPDEAHIEEEYFDLGRKRRADGVPLCELVYSVILCKQHLRQYIKENGLVEPSGDVRDHVELLPVHLYGIQELNYMVGQFFDSALYHTARGYESLAALERHTTAV